MGNWKLVVFGDGSLRWRNAAKRLAQEAAASPTPLNIEVHDRKSIEKRFPRFVKDHAVLLEHAPRGYGYWIWKPFLIREALRQKDVSGVVCLDAGSTLNFSTEASRRRWTEYQAIASEGGGLFFQMGLTERQYTKPELLDHLRINESIRDSGQLEGGHVVLGNQAEAAEMADAWYQMARSSQYRFLDDSRWQPSDQEFVAHRHDQSILSCLVKQTGFGTVIPQETYFAPEWTKAGAKFPIWGTRLKSGRSFFKPQRTIRGHHIGTASEFAVDLANAIKRRTVQRGTEDSPDPDSPPWRD